MAHSTILSTDIFYTICQSLPPKSLAVLARTAKGLQDPALRKLWSCIKGFSHLLFPFGSSVGRTGGKMYFCNVPTSSQWDRFRFYAQYVRNLEIGCDNNFEESCLSMLLHHHPLLPHLKSLRVSMSWPNEAISTISMFFVASMRKFEIFSSEVKLLALESLIATLAVTAPALRDLTISILPLDQREFGAIAFFQSLYSIDMPLGGLLVHSALAHLSALPSLSTLRFFITHSAKLSDTGSKYLFPAARDLHVESESVIQSLRFMNITQFNNLTTLEISSVIADLRDVSCLFPPIAIFCGQFLDEIKISIYGGGHREPVKFSTIYPLFKFTDLRSFTFVTEQVFWPTDKDAQAIAESWPNIRVFNMNYDRPDFRFSPLTLTGLMYLIEKCTSLMEISVAVDAMEVPYLTRRLSRPGLVINIHPYASPIDSPKSVAKLLSLLPEADIELDSNGVSETEYWRLWQEVVSLREYFIEVREEEEQRSQELQVALDKCRLENARLRALNN